MTVDLHLHSNASDGSDSPARVVELAATAQLSAIALTDHDTLDGIGEARQGADRVGLQLIPGAELSVDWPAGALHILVYYLEPGPGPLQDRLGWLQQSRADRNRQIALLLQDQGIDITYADAMTQAEGRGVGRPHFAALLVAGGYAVDIRDAFDRYLAVGRSAYLPRARLGAEEAIDLARASGAVPVVAHPHTVGISAEDYAAAFSSLAAAGLGGIEAYYAEYEAGLREHLANVADNLGLVATGGSDYHGTYKPGIQVGIGRGDLAVDDSVIAKLQAEVSRR